MPGCTTYPSLWSQSHESCNLPAILPDFYKGKSRFELEIFCKLVYRKLQRTIRVRNLLLCPVAPGATTRLGLVAHRIFWLSKLLPQFKPRN